MSNSKFIFTFLVITHIVLTPLTGSATAHNAIQTSSVNAAIFTQTKGDVRVNPKNSKAKSFKVANMDSWEAPVANTNSTN